MSIRVFKPYINRKDMDSVLNCLVSEKIENGVLAKQLASDISKYLGTAEGFLLKEYRRSLEIIIKSIDSEGRKKLLISPLAPLYYKTAAEDSGLEIVYIDIDPDTACISYDKLSKAAEIHKDNIHSIVVDSPLGFVPEIERIMELGFTVIEDISNSFGSEAGDKKAGCFGNFTILNMDPDKIITTGSGTYIAAGNKKERDALKNTIHSYGYDVLLPDMNAAVAITQLANSDKLIKARQDIADSYTQAVMKTRNKALVQKNSSKNVFYSFPVIAESGIKEIKKYAAKKDIEVSEAFNGSIIKAFNTDECPEAYKLNMRCVLFPLYPNIGKSNAEKIVKVISTLP